MSAARTRRFVIAFGGIVAAGLWLGCTIWNDAALPEPAPIDGTTPPTGSTSGVVPTGCARAAIDAAVPKRQDGTGGDIDIVLAVQSITLGDARRDFGYDLDGVCTESCVPRVPDGGTADGDEGRDNAAGSIIAGLGIDPAAFANDSFARGSLGILARIRNYNGEANDDEIAFSLYRSTGVPSGKPRFDDPNQEWKLDPTDLKNGAGGDLTAINESTGFVRDHVFIVDGLDTSKIPFNSDSDILLHNVSFTGRLELSDGRWNAVDAIGVGRWGLTDALQTIAHVKDPNDENQRLCHNPLLFGLARGLACKAADLTLKRSDDARGVTCNALSTAVGFVTAPAKLGPIDEPERKDACEGVAIGGCD